MNQGFNGWSVMPPATVSVPYVNIQDQKTAGTAGGTATSGAWQTRDLNTIAVDSAGIASLSSNQFTLPAGTYRCSISAPTHGTTGPTIARHMARLQNITDAATTLWGTSEFSAANATSRSFITGRFTISAAKTFQVQHQVGTTATTDGWGVDSNTSFAVNHETYTVAEFWKES